MSLPLGVGRLTAECVEEDPPTKSDRRRLAERIASALDPAVAPLRRLGPRSAIGTSGTLNDLVRMAVALDADETPSATNALTATRTQLDALHEQVGGDDRAPAAAARRIQEPADESQRLDDLGLGVLGREQDAADQQVDADRHQPAGGHADDGGIEREQRRHQHHGQHPMASTKLSVTRSKRMGVKTSLTG